MREESFTAVASSGAEKKGIAVSEECLGPLFVPQYARPDSHN